MKNKILLLSFMCIVVCTNVLSQNMNKDYSKIRGDIVKKVFQAYGKHFPDSIDASSYNRTTQFFKDNLSEYDSVKKKSIPKKEYKQLLNTLGNMPALKKNETNEELKKQVTDYLEQAVKGCWKLDTSWVPKTKSDIAYVYIKYGGQIMRPEEEPVAHVDNTKGKNDDDEVHPNNDNKRKPERILFMALVGTVMGGVILIGGVAGYRCLRKIKEQPKDVNTTTKTKQEEESETGKVKETSEPPVPTSPTTKSEPPITSPIPSSLQDKKWVLLGASVKGNGHIQSNMPCQDNHKFVSIGNGWGVAVVSDGAGSAPHSELGSNVVVKRGVFHFKNLIEKEEWQKNNTLPTDMEWWQKSYDVLKTIRNEVALVAKKNNIEVKSLSATCLAVIYSPLGLLAVHVGDGRMGYKSATGEWKAMMTPHKGEEANQTIFLVSDFWSIPNFALSGVLVPESIVVREPVKAFTLMSDGCENTSWLCTTQNPETGKYFDQNKPFEGFFNPLEETLISFQANYVSCEEQQAKWNKFIESGTDGFVREQDDKTMIYGFCCSQQEIDDYIEKSKVPAPSN